VNHRASCARPLGSPPAPRCRAELEAAASANAPLRLGQERQLAGTATTSNVTGPSSVELTAPAVLPRQVRLRLPRAIRQLVPDRDKTVMRSALDNPPPILY